MTKSVETCPWELLGVSPEDDRAKIRKAWRDLVRRYHPDLAGTDRDAANRKLAEINAAFDIVWDRDAARRKLEEDRKARAARKTEAARRAEAARHAQTARRAEHERRARAEDAARRDKAAREGAGRMAATRPAGWSRADRLAAMTALQAFDRARRVFDGLPTNRRPAVYV